MVWRPWTRCSSTAICPGGRQWICQALHPFWLRHSCLKLFRNTFAWVTYKQASTESTSHLSQVTCKTDLTHNYTLPGEKVKSCQVLWRGHHNCWWPEGHLWSERFKHQTHKVDFGLHTQMPSCTYTGPNGTYLVKKFFFSVFRLVPTWDWYKLPTQYLEGPYQSADQQSLDSFFGSTHSGGSLVSFPDDFSLSGGKILLVIRLFRFGAGALDVGTLFYFNLTRDVTRITFRNSSVREPPAKNKQSRQLELLVWPSLSVPTGRGKSLCYAILSYVQTNLTWKTALSISVWPFPRSPLG